MLVRQLIPVYGDILRHKQLNLWKRRELPIVKFKMISAANQENSISQNTTAYNLNALQLTPDENFQEETLKTQFPFLNFSKSLRILY